MVYIPIYFLWIFYAIKSRTFFFFNACNPRIKNGGFMAESKKEIYDSIPQQSYPKTELIHEKIPFDKVIVLLEESKIKYPFIAKPDIGLRGSAVKKIHAISELEEYHTKANFDYLIQNLIPYAMKLAFFTCDFLVNKRERLQELWLKNFWKLPAMAFQKLLIYYK
jgi:hypothetical protein